MRDFCGVESCIVVQGTDCATDVPQGFTNKYKQLVHYFSFRNARVGGSSPLSGTRFDRQGPVIVCSAPGDSCRFLILIMGLLVACAPPDRQSHLEGGLLFGSQGLMSIHFPDGGVVQEFRMDNVSIHSLSAIDSDRLLLSLLVLSPTNRRDRVVLFDSRTRDTRVVVYGSNGRFMPSGETVVYYDESGRLARVSLGNPPETSELIDDTRNPLPPAVVPIANDKFPYESKWGGGRAIWLYDMTTEMSSEVRALEGCSLVHAIWRSATGELLCSEVKRTGIFTGRYLLATLDGRIRNVDLGSNLYWPVLYIQATDDALLQQRTLSASGAGEEYRVWLYHFSTETKELLAGNVMLSDGPIYVH